MLMVKQFTKQWVLQQARYVLISRILSVSMPNNNERAGVMSFH
jgi:hypothetical protein